MIPRRILALHDSPHFGGHERAFLTWLPALLQSPEVARIALAHPPGNTAFARALRPFTGPKVELQANPFVKRRAEPVLAPFRLAYRRWARDLIAAERPHVVLLLQGRIENLCAPMLAFPPDLEVVSYLPMAHSGREMGRHALPAALADSLKRRYYGRPNRFIVPSEAVAGQLRHAGARGAVLVVRNVPEGRAVPPAPARDRKIALCLGRAETRQKGLDRLIQSMRLDAAQLRGWEFRFVGDGPDLPWLRNELGALTAVSSTISPWTNDPGSALAAADLVLMPSRWEGVPLVLLEALAARKPVLASPIDAFQEHLPQDNLFAFGHAGLAAAMEAAVAPARRERFAAHARSLDPLMDLSASQTAFVAAVLGRPEPQPSVLKGAA